MFLLRAYTLLMYSLVDFFFGFLSVVPRWTPTGQKRHEISQYGTVRLILSAITLTFAGLVPLFVICYFSFLVINNVFLKAHIDNGQLFSRKYVGVYIGAIGLLFIGYGNLVWRSRNSGLRIVKGGQVKAFTYMTLGALIAAIGSYLYVGRW